MVTCPKGVPAVNSQDYNLTIAGDRKTGKSHVTAQHGMSKQIQQSFNTKFRCRKEIRVSRANAMGQGPRAVKNKSQKYFIFIFLTRIKFH